jgi:cob(I)alamin adenosyltransferase
MKIYTGTGDRGRTGLFSGERVLKCHDRIEAYGDVDELTSIVGVVAASIPSDREDLREELHTVQSVLLHIGAWLAATPGSNAVELLQPISSSAVETLEAGIDRMETELPTLRGFLLPGGHIASSWAHVGRTVCRRAERRVVRLVLKTASDRVPTEMETVHAYLNRLSDYLFVMARYLNRITETPEKQWELTQASRGRRG